MSATGSTGDMNQGGNPADGQPRLQALAQYVKDLSFENPAAPRGPAGQPSIDTTINLQARSLDADGYPDRYEVVLQLRLAATAEDNKPVFLIELAYAGLFQIENVPAEVIQQVLLIECPHLIFPFARRVIADTVRDGGLPQLMIEPIDFAALFRSKMAEMQGMRGGPGAPATN